MRAILFVPVVLMMSAGVANAGPCPASVTDDVQAPDGGSAQVEHRFRYVSFYDGDPKEQADLAPDDGPDPKKLEQRWELTRTPGRPITMVCRYHDTDRTVVSVVPPSVKGCKLSGEMDDHGEVLGSPTLECK